MGAYHENVGSFSTSKILTCLDGSLMFPFSTFLPWEFKTQIPDSQLPWSGGVGSLQHPPRKRKLEMTVVKRIVKYFEISETAHKNWSQEILKDTSGLNLYHPLPSLRFYFFHPNVLSRMWHILWYLMIIICYECSCALIGGLGWRTSTVSGWSSVPAASHHMQFQQKLVPFRDSKGFQKSVKLSRIDRDHTAIRKQ
jgi:hypothetical protein